MFYATNCILTAINIISIVYQNISIWFNYFYIYTAQVDGTTEHLVMIKILSTAAVLAVMVATMPFFCEANEGVQSTGFCKVPITNTSACEAAVERLALATSVWSVDRDYEPYGCRYLRRL